MARKSLKTPTQVRPTRTGVGPSPEAMRAHVFPDIWAESLKLRVDSHPFALKGREFQRDIIRDESEWIICPKGAQIGLTTVFVIRTFHWAIKRKWHHLYLLPVKVGAKSFVQGRMDAVIESSASLSNEFKNVDNVTHKQTRANVAIRIRGTNIWNELREIPSDVLVMDERDRMVEENIPEAMARLDGSDVKRIVELSTPTAPGHGVDAEDAWPASDQHRWYVPCPHCNRQQTLTVDENVVIGDSAPECFVRCVYCKREISDVERAVINARGSWQAENINGSKRGYHINQLNSPTQTIERFMNNFFAGQTDARKLRAWWNNNRGEAFVSAGDQITPQMLDKCIEDGHTMGGIPSGPVYIGVDVGAVLHVRADYVDRFKRRIFWQIKRLADKKGGPDMWEQLDEWLGTLSSFTAIIDAHPEKTKAQALAKKYHKRVWIGFEKDAPDQAETAVFNNPGYDEVGKVNIDRTAAFDTHIGRLIDGRFVAPADGRTLGEQMPRSPYNGWYYQLCQQAAIEEEDTKGRIIRRWQKNSNPDHWHHAEMFCEIATMKRPYGVLTPAMGDLMKQTGNLVATG